MLKKSITAVIIIGDRIKNRNEVRLRGTNAWTGIFEKAWVIYVNNLY